MLPTEHLNALSKAYPEAWSQVNLFRNSCGKKKQFWPEWCFLPMGFWHAMMDHYAKPAAFNAEILAAVGTWRYSQGIYRFDPTFYEALNDTPFDGTLPADIFHRLPEWCVYIETPGIHCLDMQVHGFWCHLVWDKGVERTATRLALLLNTHKGLMGISLDIGLWTLKEGIERAIQLKENEHLLLGTALPAFQKLISLVIYLCSQEPEIEDRRQAGIRPSYAKPVKTKKGIQFFPAEKPRVWTVGCKIGEQLLNASQQQRYSDEETPKVRPHLRRAHWHGYWTGPKEGERSFIYKWLPPIFCGEEDKNRKIGVITQVSHDNERLR